MLQKIKAHIAPNHKSDRSKNSDGHEDIVNGFYAAVKDILPEHTYFTVDGEAVFQIGHKYLSVDFMPEGRVGYERERLAESLFKGINGMALLLETIDSGELPELPIFGYTNMRLATIAQRLGFRVVDQDMNPDGSFNDTSILIVGKVADIRGHLKLLMGSDTYERLQKRISKSMPFLAAQRD